MQSRLFPPAFQGRAWRLTILIGFTIVAVVGLLYIVDTYWTATSTSQQGNLVKSDAVTPPMDPIPASTPWKGELSLLSLKDASLCSGLSPEPALAGTIKEFESSRKIPYGQEFWRKPTSQRLAAFDQRRLIAPHNPGSINAAEVIERVTHAFQAILSESGAQVTGASYQAAVDRTGLKFKPASPNQPKLSPGQAFGSEKPAEGKFLTAKISRQQEILYSSEQESSQWTVEGNTAQRWLNLDGSMVEHYEAGQAGVAVTWVLMQPMQGYGALSVETELTGLSDAQPSETGVHFADANGISRVCVGPVQLVDSRGSHWNVPWQVEGQRLRIEIDESILNQAVYPLAIDPLISAEFGLDQPIVTTASFSEMAPSVGINETMALVVWTRGRGETSDPGIRGVRISRSGQVLDPFGFEISSLAAEQAVTAVGVCSNDFLVVWSGLRGTSVTDWDIYGVRINAEGVVLDSPPLTICGLSGSIQTSPAVAANGSRYLVVWRDSRSTGIYGTLVGRDGSVQTPNGLPICTAANDQYHPSVASLNNDFLVVWQDFRKASSSQYYGDIYGARISGEGLLLDTNGIAIGTKTNTQWQPSVAAAGTNYLVVWEEFNQAGNDIYGARISPSGQVLETNGIAICTARNLQASPVVTGQGDQFLVVWQDHRNSTTNNYISDIYGARVSVEGLLLEADGFPMTQAANNQCRPAVSASQDFSMAVWQDYRNSPSTLLSTPYGAWVGETNSLTSPNELALGKSPNAQISPAIAFLGTNYLVVWADNRNIETSGWDIYGARVEENGHIQDVSGIPISTAGKNQMEPAVAAGSNSFMVVWTDYRNSPAFTNMGDIYGTQVGLDGKVSSPGGWALSSAAHDQSAAAITSDGSRFMVVWQDARNSPTNTVRWDIYGALYDPNLRCVDQRCLPESFPISLANGNQQQPAIAAHQGQYLVVWTDYRNGSTADIYGTGLHPDGMVMETNGLAICTARGNQTSPSVAGLFSNYLVTWTDFRNGSASDIYGTRFSLDHGVLDLDGIVIRNVANHQSYPQVTPHGSDYLAIWQDARSGISNNYDIIGVALNGSGQVLETTSLSINTNANHQTYPVMAGNGQGSLLVLYQSSQFGMTRIAGQRIDLTVSNNTPARLHSARRSTNGAFEFAVAGQPGLNYAIEATDLSQAWVRLTAVRSSNGVLRFEDHSGSNLNQRFYRVITLP